MNWIRSLRNYYGIVPVAVPLLLTLGCTRWDKAPETPPVKADAPSSTPTSFSEAWCASKEALRSEPKETVDRIYKSVLDRNRSSIPPFKDAQTECEWVTKQILDSGTLDLSPGPGEKAIKDLRPISTLRGLKRLVLRHGEHTIEDLSVLTPVTSLQHLDLSHNKVAIASLDKLAAFFPDLMELVLDGAKLPSGIALRFSEFRSLKSLSLARAELVAPPYDLPQQLRSLNLAGNPLKDLTDLALRNHPHLESLNLDTVPIESLPYLPPTLNTLSLSGNLRVLNIEGFAKLVEQKREGLLPQLKKVIVGPIDGADVMEAIDILQSYPTGIELVESGQTGKETPVEAKTQPGEGK
jgi:hypothetical protein